MAGRQRIPLGVFSVSVEHSQDRRIVRLFPLPNSILFPSNWLPLHIFEPRYRQMTEDALEDDRQIAIVLPKAQEGPEPVPIHSVGCLGTIVGEQRLPDGRFLFLLRGEHRIVIQREISVGDRSYRQAEVAVPQEVMSPYLQARRRLQRAEILHLFKGLFSNSERSVDEFAQFLEDRCHPSIFADVVGCATPLPVQQKQQLLEELSIDRRLELLYEFLQSMPAGRSLLEGPTFPPPILSN